MISGIRILQSASPTLANPSAFAVTITFNTDFVAGPSYVASVVANWGKTPAFGQVATGSAVSTNPDGTVACTVTIQADQSVPANFFQLVVTNLSAGTDSDGLSCFSTRDFTVEMRGLWEKQYQGLTAWDAITKVFGYRMNQAHTAILQLAYMRALQRAVGAQVDSLGALVGLVRGALNDSDFLDLILSRIVQFNGNATADDLINIANLIGRPSALGYVEGVASFTMLLIAPNPEISHNDVIASLGAAKLAGVKMTVLQAQSPVFTFDRVDASHAGFDLGHLAGPY